MDVKDLIIVGSGGFGREVFDIVMAANEVADAPNRWNLLGYLDDAPSELNTERAARQGMSILGPADAATVEGRPHFVVAINDGRVREAIATRLIGAGWSPATLVHPSATVGSDCRIGAGTIMAAGARVTTNVSLGKFVHLHVNTSVGHDADLGDFVAVNPLGAVSGSVIVGPRTLVGSCAFILQGLHVGADTTIGANAAVVKNVPEGVVVRGVPAR